MEKQMSNTTNNDTSTPPAADAAKRTRRGYDDFAACLTDETMDAASRYTAVTELLGIISAGINNAEKSLTRFRADLPKAMSLQMGLAAQMMTPEQKAELLKALQGGTK